MKRLVALLVRKKMMTSGIRKYNKICKNDNNMFACALFQFIQVRFKKMRERLKKVKKRDERCEKVDGVTSKKRFFKF